MLSGGGGGDGSAGGAAPPGGGAPGLGQPTRTATTAAEEKPKSTLSAEAKEWFPPNYVQQPAAAQDSYSYPEREYHPPQHHHQHHGNHHHNNHHHHHNNYNSHYGGGGGGGYGNQVYYPNYTGPVQQQHGYGGGGHQRYSAQNRIRHHRPSEENQLQDSLTQLMGMLNEVTFSPGRFASLSGPLVDSFTATLNDMQHTRPLVDAIVNQAIKEQNFRYNAARLCTMFDSVELQLETPSVFRACLLERCAAEEVSINSGSGMDIDHVCGFAMFLAELYMQFENPEGGRIKALGESLCKVLKHLLTTPANNSTKAVCQVLKLSGLALDADCRLHVDDIFVGLRESEAAGVQAPLVRNVINLRQSRWGSGGFAEMVDSDASTPPANQNNHQNGVGSYNSHPPAAPARERGGGHRSRNNNDNGNGMFYLPDGHALTSEEAAFLNQHLPQSRDQSFASNDDDDADDNSIPTWDPEMDEEQQADFMEFLRLSNQVYR